MERGFFLFHSISPIQTAALFGYVTPLQLFERTNLSGKFPRKLSKFNCWQLKHYTYSSSVLLQLSSKLAFQTEHRMLTTWTFVTFLISRTICSKNLHCTSLFYNQLQLLSPSKRNNSDITNEKSCRMKFYEKNEPSFDSVIFNPVFYHLSQRRVHLSWLTLWWSPFRLNLKHPQLISNKNKKYMMNNAC